MELRQAPLPLILGIMRPLVSLGSTPRHIQKSQPELHKNIDEFKSQNGPPSASVIPAEEHFHIDLGAVPR